MLPQRIYIVHAAKKGIEWTKKVFKNSPGLIISISDGNDIYFRKAKFNPLRMSPSLSKILRKSMNPPLQLIILGSKRVNVIALEDVYIAVP